MTPSHAPPMRCEHSSCYPLQHFAVWGGKIKHLIVCELHKDLLIQILVSAIEWF